MKIRIKKLFRRCENNPQSASTIKATPEIPLKDNYSAVFLKRNEIKTRQCVYISHRVHSLILRLVRTLVESGNEVTLGGYIDTVLEEHLNQNKEEINELYRQKRGDLL